MDISSQLNNFLSKLNLHDWAQEFVFEWPFSTPITPQDFTSATPQEWLDWLSMLGLSLAYPLILTAIFFAVILIRKRRIWQATLTAPLLALCVLGAAGGFTRTAAPTPQADMHRIAHLNAYVLSDILSPKIFFLTRSGAEVASIVEANTTLLAKLNDYKATFPHQLAYRQGPHHSTPHPDLYMALVSKYPVERLNVWSEQAILYRISAPQPYYLLQIHLPSPAKPSRYSDRNRIWNNLTNLDLPSDLPLVVVGDANTTPWDSKYQTFLKRHLLTFAGPYAPSFPSWAPLLPLDHVALTAGIGHTIRRIRVPNTDHLGLLLDISFTDAATFKGTGHLAQ